MTSHDWYFFSNDWIAIGVSKLFGFDIGFMWVIISDLEYWLKVLII